MTNANVKWHCPISQTTVDSRYASNAIMSMAHDCKKFKTQRLAFLGVCVCVF